ncbi:CBN-CLEC-215 protein [Caenorhabditis brenneri]|uniref:CBN-CLEC-215 protein n=1 Tax=Caenorhabditis brenneri TaxID=135651 RepID=G0PI41_CAEBE|nr:CBN-CLEC-215 protein [Caenorhabditis brenneri]
MIVITGSLNNHNGCVSQETESFSKCVAACGNSETCQVCYGAGNRICVLCDTGIVHTNNLSQKLGVKTKMKTSTTTTNLPPGNVLPKNNLDTSLSCKDGFEKFQLPDNSYRCKKIFSNYAEKPTRTPLGYSKDQAQEKCINESAIISGLETEKELEYAITLFKRLSKSYGKDINMWIDGEFRKECYNKASTTEDCEGLKGFQFSDPLLQNFSWYHWADNEPSIDYSLGDSVRFCLKLMVPQETEKGKNGRNLGKVAVVACSSSDPETLPSAVLCGAPPIENS